MFRYLGAKALKAQWALILTIVRKVLVMSGHHGDTEDVRALRNAAMVVAFNKNVYILMHAILPRTPVSSRILYDNTCADPSAASGMPQSKSIDN